MKDFYNLWSARLSFIIDGYIYNDKKELNPPRNDYIRLIRRIEQFLDNTLPETGKITLITGIRGVGKTTLLTQLYNAEKFPEEYRSVAEKLKKIGDRVYIDAGRLHMEQLTLNDYLKHYEKVSGTMIEKPEKKIIFFIDEVHYDENWGLFLKNLFDRTKGTKDVLVIATGSSAIRIKMNPDLARRSHIVEMYPMKFCESVRLRYKVSTDRQMQEKVCHAIFMEKDNSGTIKALKELEPYVDGFYRSLPEGSVDEYFAIGGFPFQSDIKNDMKGYEAVKNVISGIVAKDIAAVKKFKTQVLSKIYELIYLLASSDTVSYDKLLSTLGIGDYRTLEGLLESLEQCGVIIRVKSYGRAYHSARKTPKFLFVNPCIRAAMLDGLMADNLKGKKIEDYFALIYQTDIKPGFGGALYYDSSESGADFIIRDSEAGTIIVETGFNKEDIEQVNNTAKRIKGSKKSIIFGSERLETVSDNILKIPLKYLLFI